MSYKFKKDDRVKITNRKYNNYTGDGSIGKYGYIEKECLFGDLMVCSELYGKGAYYGIFSEDEIELVTEKLTTNNKTFMSKVTQYVKNLALSDNEKLLRKHGLKTGCGEYTQEGRDLVMNKLCENNEGYLITIATGLEAEEEKSK